MIVSGQTIFLLLFFPVSIYYYFVFGLLLSILPTIIVFFLSHLCEISFLPLLKVLEFHEPFLLFYNWSCAHSGTGIITVRTHACHQR